MYGFVTSAFILALLEMGINEWGLVNMADSGERCESWRQIHHLAFITSLVPGQIHHLAFITYLKPDQIHHRFSLLLQYLVRYLCKLLVSQLGYSYVRFTVSNIGTRKIARQKLRQIAVKPLEQKDLTKTRTFPTRLYIPMDTTARFLRRRYAKDHDE